jgi:hypothetical protein
MGEAREASLRDNSGDGGSFGANTLLIDQFCVLHDRHPHFTHRCPMTDLPYLLVV